MITGAKTKGYLRNINTGEMRKFMFNPEQTSHTVESSISSLNSPGLDYPLIMCTGTESKSYTFSLFLKGADIQTDINFLEGLASTTKGKLPVVLWVMGSDVKKVYVRKVNVCKTEFDKNLRCTEATLDLELWEVRQ